MKMTVEEGLKMEVSGGIVTPPDPAPRAGEDTAASESSAPKHETAPAAVAE